MNFVEISKSDDEEPVPTAWRKPLAEVVEAFRNGDFILQSGVPGVDPISQKDADSIKGNIEAYGAELSELPEKAWDTSISRWTGDNWEVLVDLFTVDEGLSDLVMFARVSESGGDYRIEVESVHVP